MDTRLMPEQLQGAESYQLSTVLATVSRRAFQPVCEIRIGMPAEGLGRLTLRALSVSLSPV